MILGSYYLLEYPKDINYEIKFNKKLNFSWDKQLFDNLDKTKNYYKKLYGVQNYRDKMRTENHLFNFNFRPFYQGLFDLQNDNIITLNIKKIIKLKDIKKNSDDHDSKDYCCKLRRFRFKTDISTKNLKDKKFEFIWSNMLDLNQDEMIKLGLLKNCDVLEIVYYSNLSLIDKLYTYLELGGRLYFALFEQPCNKKSVEIIYLLSLLFDKVLIMGGKEFLCIGYKGEEGISRKEFKKIKESKSFSIEPKVGLEDMRKYYKIVVNSDINRIKYLVTSQYNKLFPFEFDKGIKDILYSNYQSKHFMHFIAKLELMFDKNIDYIYLYKYLEKEFKGQLNNLEKIISDKIKKNSLEKGLINIIEIGVGLGLYTKVLVDLNKKYKNDIKLIINDDEDKKKNMINFSKDYISNKIKINDDNLKSFISDILKKQENKIDIILLNKTYEFDIIKKELKNIILLMKGGGLLIIDRSVNESNLELNSYIKDNINSVKDLSNKYFYIYQKIDN